MIRCEDLTVKISAKEVIKNFSCTFENGSITAILGKNGCGKTTLLKALTGLYKHSGNIIIDNVSLTDYKKNELAKKVSHMPQILSHPPITVKELVRFGRSPYTGIGGILSENDRKVADDSICECDIEYLAEKRVDRISGGEQRKAFFAMLLAQDTQNVLLDEPCANLDAEYSTKLIDIIKSLKQKNKTVIAVFHDINSALEIADRLIFIDNGYCVFSGTPTKAIEEKIPEKLFSLRRIEYKHNGHLEYFYR